MNMKKLVFSAFASLFLFLIIFSVGCKNQSTQTTMEVSEMKISSPSFSNMEKIPSKFTCDGEDINPEIIISEIPRRAKSLAIIMDDPDSPSGNFLHWIAWNIPLSGETTIIAEGSEPGIQGRNDFGELGYGGPCPHTGEHRYVFRIYALDAMLSLKEGSSRKDLEKAMAGHIIGKAELVGKYKRAR